jgi:hypothetical protein
MHANQSHCMIVAAASVGASCSQSEKQGLACEEQSLAQMVLGFVPKRG